MKHNQNGATNVLLIPLIATVVILIAAAGFGAWAFSSRQVYKNDSDQKVAAAVTVANQQTTTKLNATFAQEEKDPLNTYTGPEAYGSVVVQYPKTWSAYVNDTGSGAALVDGYFEPGVIPALTGTNSIFALRLQVTNTTYSQTLLSYQGEQSSGLATIAPYQLAKDPSVIGVEVTGQLLNGRTGTMVIMPLRSQTLEVWTESSQYLTDFNQSILPNLSFSP
jgi:hypothetical protein